jgi:hypothetical protein
MVQVPAELNGKVPPKIATMVPGTRCDDDSSVIASNIKPWQGLRDASPWHPRIIAQMVSPFIKELETHLL